MSEPEQKKGSNGGRSVADETIRLYLLGGLPDNERSALDERWVNDDELAERMLLAETELTDDYAAGKLSEPEQDLFHAKFLVTDARRRKLEVSIDLREYVSSEGKLRAVPKTVLAPKPSWVEAWFGIGFLRRPAWALAGSFVMLLMFGGIVLMVLNRGGAEKSAIVKLEPSPAREPSPVTEPSPPSSVSPAPGTTQPVLPKKPEQTRPPEEPSAPPAIATFVLLPGAVRESGDMMRVALPDGSRGVLRLQLVLETSVEGFYRAELLTDEGQSVLVRDHLKPSASKAGKTVVLDIPAGLLRDGDYQIKLGRRRSGEIEAIGRYFFRALQ